MEVAMPRFFFNMRVEGALVIDDDGTELPDLDAAVEDAKGGARDLIASQIRANSPSILENSFEINDDHGQLLRTVQFAEGLRKDFRLAIKTPSSIH
jgi:hypothetical protein